ncbi:FAD-dependent oxidoreductase, partial [Methylobacterium brachythecii]
MSIVSRSPADRVIVVGAGVAGLATALRLAPRPVTLVTAAPLGTGTATGWAQGGIAA